MIVTDNYVLKGEDNYDTENVYADKFNNENQRADCPRGILENISKIQHTYLFSCIVRINLHLLDKRCFFAPFFS